MALSSGLTYSAVNNNVRPAIIDIATAALTIATVSSSAISNPYLLIASFATYMNTT